MAASIFSIHGQQQCWPAVAINLGRNLPRDEYVSPLMIDLAEELTLKMRQEQELP